MLAARVVLLRTLGLLCRGHGAVALENVALRHQLSVLRRPVRRPQLRTSDRRFGARLANLVGSLRRECLDHVIVLGERHLRRLLTAYLADYQGPRTHLALEKDAPTTRRVQTATGAPVVAFPEVDG